MAAHAAITTASACPRLRAYCGDIATIKRAAFRDDTYWARPVPGFGDATPGCSVLGLAPAAHGANRTGRVFTGHHRPHQEVARRVHAIAGEHASGAIGAMGRGREAEHEQPGVGVAEARDGARPVRVVAEGRALDRRDAATVRAQSRARLAVDDGGVGGTQPRAEQGAGPDTPVACAVR